MVDHAPRIAQAFHEVYEHLAPEYGYRTRKASAKPWTEVPQANRDLMIATVRVLLAAGIIHHSEAGPCMDVAQSIFPDLPPETCALRAEHVGGHESASGMAWGSASSSSERSA